MSDGREAGASWTTGERVSARGAAAMLAEVGIDRETTRRVLKAGLAGAPTVVGRTHAFERARVEELLRVPLLEPGAVADRCRLGTFVARLRPRQNRSHWVGADVLAPLEEQVRAAEGPWRISALGCLKLTVRIEQEGFVPFVATVGGFVVLTAEVTGVRRLGASAPVAVRTGRTRRHAVMLHLSEPSRACGAELSGPCRPSGGDEWAAGWRQRRVVTPAGGPWLVWPSGLWGDSEMWDGTGGATTIEA